MNTNPIVDVVDFIAPYDDELYILFLGDNLNAAHQNKFKKTIKKARKSIGGFIPEANYAQFTTSELFRNKAKEFMHSESCIIIADSEFSQNIIQYITNLLPDEMEGMLIDKFILQAPQDKFIFDVHSIDDDTLNALITILDERTTAFNYFMSGNHLAIWVIDSDEFIPNFQP
jgi:hypothetical protein